MRRPRASFSLWPIRSPTLASAAPPRTVKSSPPTTTGTAVDLPGSVHEVGRREGGEAAALVVSGAAGQNADFVERARIEQTVDALADGQASGIVLPLDVGRAAHFSGEGFAASDLVEFGLPAHCGYCTRMKAGRTRLERQLRLTGSAADR